MAHKQYIDPISGEHFPSVTEILGSKPKPWLDAWRDKWGVLADRKTKCANDVGTAFHSGAEALALGADFKASGRIYNMLVKFDKWREACGFTPLETELHVVSRLFKYAGTFDAVGTIVDYPDEICIFDWKTNKVFPKEADLQLSAYAQAYFEDTDIRITRGFVVHVDKKKPHHRLTVKEYKLTKTLFNRFLRRLKEFRENKA